MNKAKVCESEEKGYIEYNDKIYMPIVQCINNFEYTKERKVDGSFVVLIPKDLHDYKIRIAGMLFWNSLKWDLEQVVELLRCLVKIE